MGSFDDAVDLYDQNQPATGPGGGSFDDAVDAYDDQKAAEQTMLSNHANTIKPADAAETARLSREADIPYKVTQRNLDLVRQRQEQRLLQTRANANPTLQKYYENPVNMEVSSQDSGILSSWLYSFEGLGDSLVDPDEDYFQGPLTEQITGGIGLQARGLWNTFQQKLNRVDATFSGEGYGQQKQPFEEENTALEVNYLMDRKESVVRFKELDEKIKALTPEDLTTMQQAWRSAALSAVQLGASIPGAIAGPWGVAVLMGAQVYGDSYAKGVGAGMSDKSASAYASIQGGAEILLERTPMGLLLKSIKNKEPLKNMGKYMLAEQITEQATTGVQSYADFEFGLDKQMTAAVEAGDYGKVAEIQAHRQLVTAISTAILTGGIVGAQQGYVANENRKDKKVITDINGSLGPDMVAEVMQVMNSVDATTPEGMQAAFTDLVTKGIVDPETGNFLIEGEAPAATDTSTEGTTEAQPKVQGPDAMETLLKLQRARVRQGVPEVNLADAQGRVDNFKAHVKNISKSTTFQNAKTQFEELAQSATDAKVAINVEDAAAFFQPLGGAALADTMEILGVSEADLAVAKKQGTDIQIPLSTLMTHSDMENFDALLVDTRLESGKDTLREAEQKAEAARKEEIQGIMTEAQAILDDEEQTIQQQAMNAEVYRDFYRAALSTGRDTDEADTLARINQAFVLTQAKRQGVTPTEVVQKRPMKLRGVDAYGNVAEVETSQSNAALFQPLSVRLPTSPKSTEDSLYTPLPITYENTTSDIKTLGKNMEVLQELPNMRSLPESLTKPVDDAAAAVKKAENRLVTQKANLKKSLAEKKKLTAEKKDTTKIAAKLKRSRQAIKDTQVAISENQALYDDAYKAKTLGAAEQFLDHVVDNLLFLHDSFPADMRGRAKEWYEGGNRIAKEWATRYGLSPMQTSAVAAVLSPQKDWFKNLTQAERVLDVASGARNEAWSPEMEEKSDQIAGTDKAPMERARGKTLGELMTAGDFAAAARWVRVYDESHNNRNYRAHTPEGGTIDYMTLKDGETRATAAWGSYSEIAKGLSVIVDGSVENVSLQIGTMHKVRNFFNNLDSPNSDLDAVTIDTHAGAGALMSPFAGEDTPVRQIFGRAGSASSNMTGLKGTYPIFAEGFKRASEKRGIRSREMQSITWEALRGLFSPTEKIKNKTAVEKVWKRYQNEEITQEQAQEEVMKLAGGITPPVWAGTEYNHTIEPTYVGPAQENISQVPQKTSDSEIVFEVAPDPNNQELVDRWNKLSENDKTAISYKMAEELRVVVDAEFESSIGITTQHGGWQGKANPSLVFQLGNSENAVAIAKFVGHILSQEAMVVTAGTHIQGTEPSQGVSIELPEGYSVAQVDALYAKLWEIEYNGAKLIDGHSTRDGHMNLLNFSGMPQAEYTKAINDKIGDMIGDEFEISDYNIFSTLIGKEEYGHENQEIPTDKRKSPTRPVQRKPNDYKAIFNEKISTEISLVDKSKYPQPGFEARAESLAPVPGARPGPIRYGVAANRGDRTDHPEEEVGLSTEEFFREVVQGKEGFSEVPYIIVIEGGTAQAGYNAFSTAYEPRAGNFDGHIARSIPGYKEIQQRVGNAIAGNFAPTDTMLDIGGSEGSFAATIREVGGPMVDIVDPNQAMQEAFQSNENPEGVNYYLEAFPQGEAVAGDVAWTEDNGVEIKNFDSRQPGGYNVIHEAMTFQFINDSRGDQLDAVIAHLAPNGVFITEEKFSVEDLDIKATNEQQKNDYKSQYFSSTDMAEKSSKVLEGMHKNQVGQAGMEQLLVERFDYVVQFWDAGNFKGYMASDDVTKLQDLLSSVGDTATIYDTRNNRSHRVNIGKPFPQTTSFFQKDVAGAQAAGKSYGKAVQGATQVYGVHYSTAQRETLDSSYYGTGISGGESGRVSGDPFLSQRVHFYVNEGTGITPEAGVGNKLHGVTLNNIYDVNADTLGIRRAAQENRLPKDDEQNLIEQMAHKAGFDGVYVSGAQDKQGVAVLIGNHVVDVDNVAEGSDFTATLKPITGGSLIQKTIDASPLQRTSMRPSQWLNFLPKQEGFTPSADLMSALQFLETQDNQFIATEDLGAAVDGVNGTSTLNQPSFNESEYRPEVVAWARKKFGYKTAPDGSSIAENFVRWFGNSQVVDEKGAPLPVYHGTRSGGHKEFDLNQVEGYREGFFFAKDINVASSYTPSDELITFPTGEEIWNSEELQEEFDITIEEAFTVTDGDGNRIIGAEVTETEEELIDIYPNLRDEEFISPWYKLYTQGSLYSESANKQEILDHIEESREEGEGGAGIYTVYLKIEDPLEVDFEGNYWNEGPNEKRWEITDEDGDYVDTVWEEDSATEMKEEDPTLEVELIEGPVNIETNQYTRDAKEMGADGVIMRNVVDIGGYGGGIDATDVFVAFNPNGIKSEDNIGLYGTTDNILRQGGARGQIEFQKRNGVNNLTAGVSIITALKGADRSTILHELSHFYLESYIDLVRTGEASDLIKKDVQGFLNWFGVESVSDIGQREHEMFATAWEKYLFEGKAPTKQLETVFEQMAQWLLEIYKAIGNIRAQWTGAGGEQVTADTALDDTARNFFDRMLGAEQALENAAVDLGVDQNSEIMDDARRQMRTKVLSAVRSLLQGDTDKERIQKQVEKDLSDGSTEAGKDQIAKQFLTHGNFPGEAQMPTEWGQWKLNAGQVKEIYGTGKDGQWKQLSKISEEGGVDIDVAADLLGYRSGDELIQTMQKTLTWKQAVAAETKKRQAAALASDDVIGRPGGLPAAAVDYLHNEKLATKLMNELSALEGNLSGRTQATAARKADKQSLTQAARRIVYGLKSRDIKPADYKRAEVTARVKASFWEGRRNQNKEAMWKRRQAFNNRLYMEARDAKAQAEAGATYVTKLNKRIGKKDGPEKVDIQYIYKIEEILIAYDFNPRTTLKDIDKRKSVAKFVEDEIKAGQPIDIPQNILDKSVVKSYKDMPFGELKKLIEDIKHLEHLGKRKKKLKLGKAVRERQEAIDEIIAGMQPRRDRESAKALDNTGKSWADNVLDKTAAFGAAIIQKEKMFNILDGGKRGALTATLWDPLSDGTNKAIKLKEEAGEVLAKLFDLYGGRLGGLSWGESFQKTTYVPAVNKSFTKEETIAVALNTGNAGNYQRLIDGNGYSEAQIQSILNNLDQTDWTFVQGIWDYLDNVLWPKVEQHEKNMEGRVPEKVVAESMSNKDTRGGYYPIKYDGSFSTLNIAFNEDVSVETIFGGNYARSSTQDGHTEARLENVNQPLNLSLKVLTAHINNVIQDISLRAEIENAYKVIKDKKFRKAFIEKAGLANYENLMPWLRDVAGAYAEPVNGAERTMAVLRSNASIAAMGFSLMTAVVNLSGAATYMRHVGAVNMAGKLSSMSFKGKPLIDFARTKSEYMRSRPKHLARDMTNDMKQLTARGMMTVSTSTWYALIGYVDTVVSVAGWTAAYDQEMANSNDEAKAVKYADGITRMSQGSGRAIDLTKAESGSGMHKLFTMFFGFFGAVSGQVQGVYQQTREKGYANTGEVAKFLTYEVFLITLMDFFVRGGFLGDDDEEENKKLAAALAKYPFAWMPVVRDIADPLIDQAITGKSFGYQLSPVSMVVEKPLLAITTASKIAFGDKELNQKEFRNIVKGALMLTGAPVYGVDRTLNAAYNVVSGKTEPGLFKTPAYLIVGDKENK